MLDRSTAFRTAIRDADTAYQTEFGKARKELLCVETEFWKAQEEYSKVVIEAPVEKYGDCDSLRDLSSCYFTNLTLVSLCYLRALQKYVSAICKMDRDYHAAMESAWNAYDAAGKEYDHGKAQV